MKQKQVGWGLMGLWMEKLECIANFTPLGKIKDQELTHFLFTSPLEQMRMDQMGNTHAQTKKPGQSCPGFFC